MNAIKISVILATYNCEMFLKESVESVLRQTYKNLELIIVNDGSTDHTNKILNSFNDERLKIITCEKNRHVAYATTLGLKIAQGKYIALMDSDDIWKEDKLEKQVNYMEKHPEVGACFTKIHVIDDNAQIIDDQYPVLVNIYNNVQNKTQAEWMKFFLNTGNCLANPSVLIRTKMLDDIGRYYDLAYIPAQDYELWTRFVLKWPIYIMDEKLTYYRWVDSPNKMSGLSDEDEDAFNNVRFLMLDNLLDHISDKEFIKCLGDLFIKKDADTKVELEYEKARLLENCMKEQGNMNLHAIRRIGNILRIPGSLEVLEKEYDFNIKDFYKMYRTKIFYDKKVSSRLKFLEETEGLLKDALKEKQDKLLETNELLADYHGKLMESNQIAHRYYEMLQNEQKKNIEMNELLQSIKTQNIMLTEQINSSILKYEDMQNSVSWKLTAPLRKLHRIIKR